MCMKTPKQKRSRTKSGIVVNDLAQLSAALDLRYMRDEIAQIEMFYTMPSVSTRQGKTEAARVWINEITQYTPEEFETVKNRLRSRTPLGVWINCTYKIDNP